MSSETGNAQGKQENRGSNNPNIERQKQESREIDKSNSRDREGRKGGDNAKSL